MNSSQSANYFLQWATQQIAQRTRENGTEQRVLGTRAAALAGDIRSGTYSLEEAKQLLFSREEVC
jgi:hypothetical protein